MNDDERRFCCPECQLRIGTIEADGVLVMYPGIRIARADFVCVCGKALYWHSHEMAMDRLIERVRGGCGGRQARRMGCLVERY